VFNVLGAELNDMRSLGRWFLLFLLTYPAAITTTVILGAALGDFQFWDQLLYESKHRLLATVTQDWLSAMFLIAPIFLVVLGAMRYFSRVIRYSILLLLLGLILLGLMFGEATLLLAVVCAYSIVLPMLFGGKRVS
jgi:hypothetical protein